MFSTIFSILILAQPLPNFMPELLVSFEKSEVNRLFSLKISITEDLGQFVLGEITVNQLADLKNNRVKYQILDYRMPFNQYWLVNTKNQNIAKIKSYGKIVGQFGKTVIVKGNPNRIGQLNQFGFELKKLNRKPISMVKKQEADFGLAMPQDTFIQRVLTNVSSDSIRSFVQDLQDFETRYSPTPGCSLAAEYIHQLFSQYNLNPQFDGYFMPSDIYDVKFIYPKAWLVDDKGSAYMSPNCGDTWIVCLPGNISLLGIDFTDTLNGWLSGGDGNVLTTRDGGLNWDTLARGLADFLFRVDFIDTAFGWAVGGTGDSAVVLRTTDRGRSWTIKSVFEGSLYGIYAYDSQTCWAAGIDLSNTGLIIHTSDEGNNWDFQFSLSDYMLTGVTFTDSLKGWAVGGNLASGGAAIYHTTNGGDTWIRQTTAGYLLFDVDFIDSLNGWCCGYSTITRTTNGGTTWNRRTVEPMLYGIDFADANYGVAVGSEGRALVTTNGGNIWRTTYTHNNYTWRNVVGTKIGITNPDEIYIICGHFDAISENPFLDAPGADDNGSGTAAVLEAARILNPYPFGATIKFIGFSGEEQGLLGSAVYAESAWVHGLDIRGVLNLDMIGYLDDPNFDFNVTSDNTSEPLADLWVNACTSYTSLLAYKVIDPGAVYSDHASFWTYGYQALEGAERDGTQWNPYYHLTSDTLGTGLNSIPFNTEVIKGSIACLANLARPYGIIAVAEKDLNHRPGSISLNCSPNPMIKNGKIKWQVRTTCPVNLKLYSSSGRLVKTLFDSKGKNLDPGFYQLPWDGTDNHGLELPSGIYFVNLSTKNNRYTTKIVNQKDASKNPNQ